MHNSGSNEFLILRQTMLEFLSFCMTAELVKKVTFLDLFRGIWLSEQFLYQKKYYSNVFEFLER